MTRDPNRFPDDDNGDVLWRMHQAGDNLLKPREIDYSVIFPTEEAALRFALHLLKNEQKVSCSPYEGNAEMPWQVHSYPTMEPTHANISGYEALLEQSAAEYGGRNDGWGCWQQDK